MSSFFLEFFIGYEGEHHWADRKSFSSALSVSKIYQMAGAQRVCIGFRCFWLQNTSSGYSGCKTNSVIT